MVLDTSLLNHQQYKVRIKGKVKIQGKELHPPLHLSLVAIEKAAFWLPSTTIANFTYFYLFYLNRAHGGKDIGIWLNCFKVKFLQ